MDRLIYLTIALLFSNLANATFVSVSGGLSSNSVAASIIAAPTFVLDANVTNLAQQGFDERQGVLLGSALLVDSGSIAAGTVVNSHMIFLNKPGPGSSVHASVAWTFSGTIIGVMSDFFGTLEVASTPLLGAPGTTYPGASFIGRGFETNDSYSGIGSNILTVSMSTKQPGDRIRVITATAVPEPATIALITLGLFGIASGSLKNYRKTSVKTTG